MVRAEGAVDVVIERMSVSGDHACAIDSEDRLWCWGDRAPESVPLGRAWQVATSGPMDCVTQIGQDQGVFCWGPDAVGPFRAPSVRELVVGGGAACVGTPWTCAGTPVPGLVPTAEELWLSSAMACVQTDARACATWAGAALPAPPSEGGLVLDDALCLVRDGVTCSGGRAPELPARLGRVVAFDLEGATACWSDAGRVRCVGDDGWSAPPKVVSHVAVGRTGACGLGPTGALACWGAPDSPLLRLPAAPVPVVPLDPTDWTPAPSAAPRATISGELLVSDQEGLRVERMQCEWPGTPDAAEGLRRATAVGALVRARREALVACAPSGGAARVTFSFDGGVTSTGPSTGDPAVAACLGAVLREEVFEGTGLCATTLLVGDRGGAEGAASGIPGLPRSPL